MLYYKMLIFKLFKASVLLIDIEKLSQNKLLSLEKNITITTLDFKI